MRPNLILIGAGGHAHSCIDVIERHGKFQIAGLIGTPEELHAKRFGYSVIGTDADLPEIAKLHSYALITMGQIKSGIRRADLYRQANRLGLKFPIIISPMAYVSRFATLGCGTIVMHGAIINAGVSVGANCIINSRALLEHDAKVEENCHISTGTILNGNVSVGPGSFIGSGSNIKQGIVIGKNCLVGMGTTLKHDLNDSSHFTG